MASQAARCKIFRALHQKGNPLVLYNIWDAGSAKIVAEAGAGALATGSHPIASALGYGEAAELVPFDLALENMRRILDTAQNLPVSMDIEGGYGRAPEDVAETAKLAVETGVVGFNLEDQIIDSHNVKDAEVGQLLYTVDVQAARIAAARAVVDSICDGGIFINARTDIFLKNKPETHNLAMLEEALERAEAYGAAGADGFFAPGLVDETLIGTLCDATNLPVNIIALPTAPNKAILTELGVSRISHGPVPYKKMAAWLNEQATAAMS